MIKTFENCSPEYPITIVCFFIFLTLLCMILVIYEGTGKRQRKMLLLDSVLLIVIFLITAVLCVWQRAFYEEDSMILFKIPYVILIVIGIGVFLYVGLKIFGIYKYRKCRRTQSPVVGDHMLSVEFNKLCHQENAASGQHNNTYIYKKLCDSTGS